MRIEEEASCTYWSQLSGDRGSTGGPPPGIDSPAPTTSNKDGITASSLPLRPNLPIQSDMGAMGRNRYLQEMSSLKLL